LELQTKALYFVQPRGVKFWNYQQKKLRWIVYDTSEKKKWTGGTNEREDLWTQKGEEKKIG
jgi:hypothetical protein